MKKSVAREVSIVSSLVQMEKHKKKSIWMDPS